MSYIYPNGLIPITAGWVKNNPMDNTVMGVNNDLHGGLKVVKSREEMLAIHPNYLLKDYTACFVTNDGGGKPAFYFLVKEPSRTTGTMIGDWMNWAVEGKGDLPGGLVFKGILDPSNISISDSDPGNSEGHFYVVETNVPVQIQQDWVFGGALVTLTANDWVIFTNGRWEHLDRSGSTVINWGSITDIPSAINDLARGVLPTHSHLAADITVEKSVGGRVYNTLRDLLGVMLYTDMIAANASAASDNQLLNYAQLKSLFVTQSNLVNAINDVLSGNYYNKTQIDAKFEQGGTVYKTDLPSGLASSGIGGIAPGTTVGELENMEMTFPEFVDMLVFPTVEASVASQKSFSLSVGSVGSTVEVGTLMNAVLTAAFSRGSIKNGDGSQGPDLTGLPVRYRVSGPGIDTERETASLTETFNPSGARAVAGTNRWTAEVDHSAGTGDYFDNKGNKGSNLDSQRAAATITATSPTVSGRYCAFFGTGIIPSNSAQVRSMTGKSLLSTSRTGTFTLPIARGEDKIAFAVPAGRTVKVLFRESSGADVTGSFSKVTFNVNDAGGTPVSYDIYTSTLAGGGYPSNSNYDITIS